ncbi:zinc-binding dehydrogenase [Chryseomicrobium palamuruense]|uniref:Zinc-binding dehydrogenase n=1 Tax=Chryseomicrobium palamuruense TaxID=682973 RepID=A0ABV8UUS7_9BACL
MKAVYIQDAYQVEVQEVEVPKLTDQDVLIEVKIAGICGSDIHTYKGLHPFRKPPVIIGHEISGVVKEVGKDVTHVKVGDNVTVEPQIGCGECVYCRDGQVNLCTNRTAPGLNGWFGTMAEYFVAPKETVFLLPDTMDHVQGVLVEPLAVGVHAIRKGQIGVGSRVAILGAGPIGLLAMAVARASGATVTYVTDVLDYALDAAKEMGASHTKNIRDNASWHEEAINESGGLFDVVLIAAGIPGIIDDSLKLLRKGGKVITIAMFNGTQTFDIHNLQNQEKEIIGCMTYNSVDTETAIELLNTNQIIIEPLISHQLHMDQAGYGFQIVDKKQDNSLKVLVSFE